MNLLRPYGAHINLLDGVNPEINVQTLQSSMCIPSPPKKESLKQTLGKWTDWLLRFVPFEVKKPINNAWQP